MAAVRRERFSAKHIVVTGAAQGIGEAVVRALVSEGAFVHAIDRDATGLTRLCADLGERGEVVEPIALDIAFRDRVEAAVDGIAQSSAIDGLVNVAAVLLPGRVEALRPEDWLTTFQVNVHGTFFVSQAVARHMQARRRGSIVTVASNAASTPRVGMSAYCASKAAALMLTRCLGLELAAHGVRCNAVSPGSTRTAMLRALGPESPELARELVRGDPAAFRVGIPLGRIAEPADIATAVTFLLSEEARHITLQNLVVDGGATL